MSKKLKLSQWHDGSVLPVHVGVYESIGKGWYRLFDGKFWRNGDETIELALQDKSHSPFQNEKWRGIVK